jgi:hypothetical protein
VVALVTAIGQASFAFAPLAFGALRDLGQTMDVSIHAGGAPLVFGAAAVIQIAAAGAIMLGRRPNASWSAAVAIAGHARRTL